MKKNNYDHHKILITYDETLQLITNKESEECYISNRVYFFFILTSVLESYPEIKDKFPPGSLGFTVNGKPPCEDTMLKNGDVVHFSIPSLGNHMIEGR
ncbi:hypothetical protein ES703_17191 [subsurface metagenome]